MSHRSFLEQADRIGARICRDAIWDGGRCNWVGNDGRDYYALNPSLYAGTSGIALFLYRLSQATGETIFRDTADGALRQAWSQKDRLQAETGTGLYTGLAGVAYALSQCGQDGLSLADAAFAAPLAGEEHDLMAGAAGLVVAALYFRQPEAAVRYGEILLESARRSDRGMSWLTLAGVRFDDAGIGSPDRADLNGFSHGVAGIAWALLELWHVMGEPKYRTAAEEGFRYEQSWFDAEHGNWRDLRSAKDAYSDSWCHGAAGIAFSRLRAAELTGNEQYDAQAQAALKAVESGLPNWANGSLCHGLFGSIDLLLCTGTPERITLARDAAQDAIDRYVERRLPWPCGVPNGNETPDLMIGLAGIGHTLLRLADPAIPSPLMISC